MGVRANFDAFQRAPPAPQGGTLAASHLWVRIQVLLGAVISRLRLQVGCGMRIDYARGRFSDNELEAAYVRREWRRTTSTFAVTIVILIAALTVLASVCELLFAAPSQPSGAEPPAVLPPTAATKGGERGDTYTTYTASSASTEEPTPRAREGSNVLHVCAYCGGGRSYNVRFVRGFSWRRHGLSATRRPKRVRSPDELLSTSPAAAASPRECVDICARDGGVPACPSSAAQTLQLALLAGNAPITGSASSDACAAPYRRSARERRSCRRLGPLRLGARAQLHRAGQLDDANGCPSRVTVMLPTAAGRALGRVAGRAVRAVRGRSSPCLCSEGSAAARWPEDAAALTAQFDAAMAQVRGRCNPFVIAIAVWLFLLIVLGATDRSVLRAALNLRARRRRPSRGNESERRLAASMDAAAPVRAGESLALLAVGLLVFLLALLPQVFFLDTPWPRRRLSRGGLAHFRLAS